MAARRTKAASQPSSVTVPFDFNYETKRMVRFDADEESEFRSFYIPMAVRDELQLSEGQGIVVTISAA